MRRFLALVFGLALLGDVAAILIGPKMIHYWFEPPVQAGAQAAFNCTGALDYGISKLITMQIGGTITGLVIGLIVALLLWKRNRPVAAVAAAPAAPASTTPVKT